MTATQLADLLSIERSTVTRDVQVLQRVGLVQQWPNPSDRRERRVELTGLGHRRLAEAAAGWRQAQQQLREALGSDSSGDLVRIAQLVVERGESVLRGAS
jgi:DNA-binding MarR family transcriptional regulator